MIQQLLFPRLVFAISTDTAGVEEAVPLGSVLGKLVKELEFTTG
jgi:hypothetical protein